jgi:hypothetical protein
VPEPEQRLAFGADGECEAPMRVAPGVVKNARPWLAAEPVHVDQARVLGSKRIDMVAVPFVGDASEEELGNAARRTPGAGSWDGHRLWSGASGRRSPACGPRGRHLGRPSRTAGLSL